MTSVSTSVDASLRPYPWQLEQWQLLERSFGADKMPHSLLLAGPSEIGKQQFARAFAQRMLCRSPISGYGCGLCKPCQLMAAGTHPDWSVLEPESVGKAIKIDAVRELENLVATTAQQGGWRIILIHPAEAMNINASNALLKTLEEPGGMTLLMLVSHNTSGVIPTVRSRCRLMPFTVPSKGAVIPWLRDAIGVKEAADSMLAKAAGKPLRVVRLLESDVLAQMDEFESLLDAVGTGAVSPVSAAETSLQLPDNEAIDWLQSYLYRRLRAHSFPSQRQYRQAFVYLDRVTMAKRNLLSSANPNRQLLWEELMLDWRQVGAGGSR